MVKNKAVATAAVVGGMLASTAPAMAGAGGVGPERVPNPSGGVSAEQASPAARHTAAVLGYIWKQVQRDGALRIMTLDPENLNPQSQDMRIDVVPTEDAETDKPLTNALAIMRPDGSAPAEYVGSDGEKLVTIPADKARIVAHIGHLVMHVKNPEHLLAPHILHPASGPDGEAAGFTAENGASFGVVRQNH